MKFKKINISIVINPILAQVIMANLRPSLSEIVPMMVCAIKPPKTPQNIK